MVKISSAQSGTFADGSIAISSYKAKAGYSDKPDYQAEQIDKGDSLSLTTDIGSFFNFNHLSSGHLRQGTLSTSSTKQEQVSPNSLIPRHLSEQEAEALSNQQLKAEYGRHSQISSDSEAKQQKCISHSIVLSQNREQALHMNRLSSTLKQSGRKLAQQALAQIASGVALYASGAAMEAAGKAMLGCPFTKAAGMALVSKGKALKQRGMQMRQYGQKLELSSKNLLSSGLSLGASANKQINYVKNAWQALNNIYQQIKTVGNLAKSSMLCAENVGRKRGLSFTSTPSGNKLKVGFSASKIDNAVVSTSSKVTNSKSSAVTSSAVKPLALVMGSMPIEVK